MGWGGVGWAGTFNQVFLPQVFLLRDAALEGKLSIKASDLNRWILVMAELDGKDEEYVFELSFQGTNYSVSLDDVLVSPSTCPDNSECLSLDGVLLSSQLDLSTWRTLNIRALCCETRQCRFYSVKNFRPPPPSPATTA